MHDKIEYRKVTPEEKLYIAGMQGTAFGFNINENDIREKIEKGEYKSDNTYGAVNSDGKVIAGMEVIPYTVWFDGQKTPMSGIGSVVSAPEYRRGGHIRNIFKKVFDDIYQNGIVFSHLYPFSHDYYRMYGYEQCGAAVKYIFPVSPLRKLKKSGTVREYTKGSSADEQLINVFEAYASRHNIVISRSQEKWDGILNIPLFGSVRLYYWEDEKSIIKSWIKFEKQGDTMKIWDIAWIDNDGMVGILQFMGMYEGAAAKMSMTASPEFIAELYCPNLYEIEKADNAWLGMNRVVNVKKALELMKKPKAAGKFVIKTDDNFAEWNNAKYLVEYGAGECTVKETSCDADIELSQLALVQLILGVYEFDYVKHRNDIKINSNENKLKTLFPKKKLLIADHF